MTRDELVAEAREWLGTPYQHGQMAKGLGCDCLGFLAGVAYAVGYVDARPLVRDPALRVYGKSPDPTLLDRACEEYLDPIALADARLADVIRMVPATATRHAQHFAMVSRVDAQDRPTHLIHCTNAHPQMVVEHVIGVWRDRFRRAYAWRGVA